MTTGVLREFGENWREPLTFTVVKLKTPDSGTGNLTLSPLPTSRAPSEPVDPLENT